MPGYDMALPLTIREAAVLSEMIRFSVKYAQTHPGGPAERIARILAPLRDRITDLINETEDSDAINP